MRKFIWVIILAAIIILASVGFYVYKFNNHEIVLETYKWGAFSDYLNPFVGIANLIIITWLSVLVYKYNKEKDSQNEEFQKALEKPILILKSRNDEIKSEVWELKNVGKGAALNLKVAESNGRNINWIEPVKCYSLANGEILPLNWLKSANVICVIYEDIFKNKYVSVAADDETQFQSLNENFKPIVINQYTFDKKHFEDFMNLKTRRLHQAKNQSTDISTLAPQTTNPNG